MENIKKNPSLLFAQIHPLSDVSVHDVSDVFVHWTENPLLNYSCPTCFNFKGRDLEVFLCHNAAFITNAFHLDITNAFHFDILQFWITVHKFQVCPLCLNNIIEWLSFSFRHWDIYLIFKHWDKLALQYLAGYQQNSIVWVMWCLCTWQYCISFTTVSFSKARDHAAKFILALASSLHASKSNIKIPWGFWPILSRLTYIRGKCLCLPKTA